SARSVAGIAAAAAASPTIAFRRFIRLLLSGSVSATAGAPPAARFYRMADTIRSGDGNPGGRIAAGEATVMEAASVTPGVRHPFVDGSFKKLLIDGQWVEAASGKRFKSLNPATGDLLATVAEGDKEDIDRAVRAARRAFAGPWSRATPYDRQQL